MSLSAWLDAGILIKHTPRPQEIKELLAIVERDLRECRVPGLSPEWQLSIAYNAVLQAATAALAASGYRVRRQAGAHYYTLESLAHTVRLDPKLLQMLHVLRKKRHLSDYVRAGAVSQREAMESIELVHKVCTDIRHWLKEHHPDLLAS